MLWERIKQIVSPRTNRLPVVNILIIEDSEIDQKIAYAAIQRGGYTAYQAMDGKTGLDMAQKLLPDLIILDYNLPDLKGPEICKILKATPTTNHIPVIFLTSMDSPNSIINCYEQGGACYLNKPVNPKFLLEQIEQVLKDHKSKE